MTNITAKKAAAARARKKRHQTPPDPIRTGPDVNPEVDGISQAPFEVTSWEGGVNNMVSEDEWTYEEENEDSDIEVVESTIQTVENSQKQAQFKAQMTAETELSTSTASAFTILMKGKSAAEWKKAEANRGFGYNSLSVRRAQELRKAREDKERIDTVKREG